MVWLAQKRAHLPGAGTPHPFVDSQLAAVARVNNLALVTTNEKDFSPFVGLVVVPAHPERLCCRSASSHKPSTVVKLSQLTQARDEFPRVGANELASFERNVTEAPATATRG